MSNELKVCSLFAGAGGIDYAFIQAGYKIIWANENDYDACRTYRINFPDTVLDNRDIRKVSVHDIPQFDVLVGGFPCQPFSAVGDQLGFNDRRGNLFLEILRIIDDKNPEVVFLENVANLEQHDNGNTFRVIQDQLSKRGYTFRYLVADAQDYGFPQRRNRIYIVCFRDSKTAERFSFPKKRSLQKRIVDIIDRNAVVPEEFYLTPGTVQYRLMDAKITDCDQVYRFSDGRYGARGGILSSRNGISFTLLAGMGNWHDREPVIRDYKGLRKLTPYECFMLQGYPASFSLQGIPRRSAYRQAGNTVCVPVVRLFAEKIKAAIESIRKPELYIESGQEKASGIYGSAPERVLVGIVKNERQLRASIDNNFYHFPVATTSQNIDDVRYIAINVPAYISKEHAGIQYIGEIAKKEILPRNEIRELPKASESIYWRISVYHWKKLKKQTMPQERKAVYITDLSQLLRENT